MTSDVPTEAFVWVWPQGEVEPVVVGRIERAGRAPHGLWFLDFNYGRSYLERDGAVPLFLPELPLRPGRQRPGPGLTMAGCLRDGAPDAWGRRVVMAKQRGQGRAVTELDELVYLLESGSDRIGALDFQRSPTEYVPRHHGDATLEELMASAERVESGAELSEEIDRALLHGSSIGGARPKAMLRDGQRRFIAKFSTSSDLTNIVKAEFVAMRLAQRVGLWVAEVELRRVAGKDVLLVERFDRRATSDGVTRRGMVSALTLLGLDELMARYASYEDLAELVRRRFVTPRDTLRELFSRMVFNVLCGNTDDHARNHAAFWDGEHLELTPAYDICPQPRAGREASQAMLVAGQNNLSQASVCLQAAEKFHLSTADAQQIIDHQVATLERDWRVVCDEADLQKSEREQWWGRQFLNPFVFE